MAKQKGIIKLKGTIAGLTFYEKNGESLVRTAGGVTKKRIETDPAYKRTRENMAEFGGSAKVGKSLRLGFVSIYKNMAGTGTVGRLTGVMKRINSVGPGLRGQRAFEILPNKVLLEGFEFNLKAPLDTAFYAPNDPPTLDANRSVATWLIPDFNTDSFITPPEGASHFKLVLATSVLSDFTYNTELHSFEPVNPTENEANAVAFTPEIPLGGNVGTATTLSVDLGFAAALPTSVAVVNAIGIIFYQEINTQFYELASDNAMRIEVIA